MHSFAQKPKAAQQTMSAKSTISGRAHFGQSREVNSILHLQRTIGNQAVQRMLQTNAEELTHTLQCAASARTLQRQPRDSKAPKHRDKHAEPEWEIHLRPRPNEIGIVFSGFLFEREVLPILFKAGKLPAARSW